MVHSLNDGLGKIDYLASNPQSENPSINHVFIIGGASIYKQALASPTLTRILLTRVLEPDFDDCDAYFPNSKIISWQMRKRHGYTTVTKILSIGWVQMFQKGYKKRKEWDMSFRCG